MGHDIDYNKEDTTDAGGCGNHVDADDESTNTVQTHPLLKQNELLLRFNLLTCMLIGS